MAHRSAEELEAERLLIEAAQRDRAAFAPLYERYVDQIFAYAWSPDFKQLACLRGTEVRDVTLIINQNR